jgi:vancomycin resistance protein YoaR
MMSDPDNENPETADSPSDDEQCEDYDAGQTRRGSAALWFTTPLIIIVLLILAFGIYLSSAGVDMAWAVGTSGWVAPPGSTLAGHNIGGKTFDEVDSILGELAEEFSGLSVWLVEESLVLSVMEGDINLSTIAGEVAISVAPVDFGLSLDVHAMAVELASLDEKSGDPLLIRDRLELWAAPPTITIVLTIDERAVQEYMEGVKSTIDCEPINAELDLANRRIASARDGLAVDIDATIENIPTSLETLYDVPVELVIIHTEPDIQNDAFSGIDLDTPLGAYTTSFSTWKRNRSYNIMLIATHFEGVVIGPGEVFSFNETTGPRDYAQGYLAAPMYINRRVEMSPAGGACQVSTTLYNSALLAGLEPVERWPHSRPCGYVPYGRDATVAYGAVDLKFRNTLDHPIIIHQVVDHLGAGTITFEIFGNPDDRVNVDIGNAYSWIGRTEPQYVIDTSLAPGQEVVEDSGVNGIHQRAWRTWFDDAGNELFTEDLSNDVVRPVGAYIRHNPVDGGTTPDELRGSSSSGSSQPSDPAPSEPKPDEPPPEPEDPGAF